MLITPAAQPILKISATISDTALMEAERQYNLGHTVEKIFDLIGVTILF